MLDIPGESFKPIEELVRGVKEETMHSLCANYLQVDPRVDEASSRSGF
jgi:hypothetical protein